MVMDEASLERVRVRIRVRVMDEASLVRVRVMNEVSLPNRVRDR